MRARLHALAWLCAIGCLDARPLEAPEPPADVRSVLLLVDAGDARALIALPSAASAMPPVTLPIGATMAAFGYPTSLAELQLTPGLHTDLTRGSRRIPTAAWTAGGLFDARGSHWTPDETPRTPPEGVWLPGFDWNECLSSGGCGPVQPGADDLRCNLPCEPTTVMPPTPPEPPRGEGWVQIDTGPLDLPIFAPDVPPAVPCPVDTRQPYGAATCTAQVICPADWPAVPPAATGALYVSRTSGGGAGSREAPFATLQEALAVHRAGQVILLDEGDFTVPSGILPPTAWIVGRCPQQTRLSSPTLPLSAGGGVTLEAVSLPPLAVTSSAATLRDVRWSSVTTVALRIDPEAQAELTNAWFEGGSGGAIQVDGGELNARDVVIQGGSGIAIECKSRGHVAIERLAGRSLSLEEGRPPSHILSATDCGVRAHHLLGEDIVGSGLVLIRPDAVVADLVLRRLSGEMSFGIAVDGEGRVDFDRVFLDDNERQGIVLTGGVRAFVTDLVSRDAGRGLYASVLHIGDDTVTEFRRVYMDQSAAQLLYTGRQMQSLLLQDFIARARWVTPDPHSAIALEGGRTTVERMALVVAVSMGITTRGDSDLEVELTDLHIEGSATGVVVEPEVEFTATRVRVLGARQSGLRIGAITSRTADATTYFYDLSLLGTLAGPGLDVDAPTTAVVQRFDLSDNRIAGARLAAKARLELIGGRVAGQPVGVIRDPDALGTIEDLVRGVVYTDNDVPINER